MSDHVTLKMVSKKTINSRTHLGITSFSAIYDFEEKYFDHLQTIYEKGKLCGTFTPMPETIARSVVDNTMKYVFNWFFNRRRSTLEQINSCSTSMDTVLALSTVADISIR